MNKKIPPLQPPEKKEKAKRKEKAEFKGKEVEKKKNKGKRKIKEGEIVIEKQELKGWKIEGQKKLSKKEREERGDLLWAAYNFFNKAPLPPSKAFAGKYDMSKIQDVESYNSDLERYEKNVKRAKDYLERYINKRGNIDALLESWDVTLLYMLAWKDGMAGAEIALKKGANPNFVCKGQGWREGTTPLHMTPINNNYEIAEYLIKHGAKVNAQDKFGHTPLMVACSKVKERSNHDIQQGSFECVEILLKNKADPNIQDKKRKTALHYLIDKLGSGEYRIKCLNMLIEAGANPNIKDKKGWTPLVYACKGRDEKYARILLENDADINIKDNEGKTLKEMNWKGYLFKKEIKKFVEKIYHEFAEKKKK